MAQHPAREELAELLLDEARQAVRRRGPRVAGGRAPGPADDGVEDGVFGVAGLICAMWTGHVLA
jgi:hypothetical protein